MTPGPRGAEENDGTSRSTDNHGDDLLILHSAYSSSVFLSSSYSDVRQKAGYFFLATATTGDIVGDDNYLTRNRILHSPPALADALLVNSSPRDVFDGRRTSVPEPITADDALSPAARRL